MLRSLLWIEDEAAAAIARRRERVPCANVYELVESLPRPARRRSRASPGPLLARVAFSPRWAELVARAVTEADTRLELRGGAEVAGNARRLLPGTVERVRR